MVSKKPLVRNEKPVTPRDLVSLATMLAPGALFGAGLVAAHRGDARYAWLADPGRYPAELWLIAAAGLVATAGGVGDWLFHRAFVTVGPREHRSHLLALATGGLPLFGLMAAASVLPRPGVLLVPVLVVVLYTAALICFDEFVFHRPRCRPVETLFHRLLVFGNGVAWLAWVNWCFVRGGAGA
ncbi:MAG: hypothetical protein JWO31_4294 [Phycisphaerales bacterium]|nr:hypothetical protein [Phycisphaerales bacterium]